MTDKNSIDQIRTRMDGFLDSDSATVSEAKELLRDLNGCTLELERLKEDLLRRNHDLKSEVWKLNEFHKEYSDLFDNAPVGVVIVDNAHIIQKANKTFLKNFVHPDDCGPTPIGRPFDDFVYPEFRQLFYQFAQTLRKQGSKSPLEIRIFDAHQAPRDVVISGYYSAETSTHHLVVLDVTQQRLRERTLTKAKEKAEESDRKKSLFLASLGHELRSSLSTIVGYCDLLSTLEIAPEVQKEYLKSIHIAGQMLSSLSDEMLDLFLLESGNVSLRDGNVNIVQMCDEIATFAQGAVQQKDVKIRSQMDMIPILRGDEKRLRQVISSVINHAVSNAVGGTILIRGRFIQYDSQSGILFLNVIGDNIFSGESGLKIIGRRLPPAERNSIGLGLYNTSQVLKILKGKMIWVHPLNSLRIEIPLNLSTCPMRDYDKDSSEALSPGTNRACLLVDDVPQNLDVLNSIMQHLGYTTTATDSAKEALNLMSEKHFDFVLTDLWMPEMNGEELAEAIRQNPAYDDILIYAVTADIDYQDNFDMSLFKATFLKPITIEKLRKFVVTMKKLSGVVSDSSNPG